ncbi:MAG TPA: zinc ribbon domain-containing protein [Pyrinomonadaceae bacterium]|nr:zinc ribbon domain-containing protein [Pyrinomonadaceae bacterium]
MSSVPCTNCGAEISPGTKFCRRCGQPSLDTASVSEATTRVFEATAERKASPTEAWNAQPTGPAYLSPSGNSGRGASPLPPQDATTKSLGTTGGQGQKKTWLVVSVIAVLLVMLFVAMAVGVMVSVRKAATTQTPPVVVRPETGLPPAPPVPPVPPGVEPPAAGATVPTSELMYPGAGTVMDMKSNRDNFLELRTNDPISKVVDWYTAKLKPSEVLRSGGTEAILRTGRTSVIISTRGSATDILIKQGVER